MQAKRKNLQDHRASLKKELATTVEELCAAEHEVRQSLAKQVSWRFSTNKAKRDLIKIFVVDKVARESVINEFDEESRVDLLKPFICIAIGCEKNFVYKSVMKRHYVKMHTELRPFECSMTGCEKRYATKDALRTHIKKFHDKLKEKLVNCKFEGCGLQFRRSYMPIHIRRTHLREKPFVCTFEDCKKSFSTAFELDKHVPVHTGKQRFSCTYGDCSFVRAC